MTRYCLLVLGGALAPLGCSNSSGADYQFGAAEMEQLVVGTWSGTWGQENPDGGASDSGTSDADMVETSTPGSGLVPFTLRIERVLRTGARPLCDSRPLASPGSSTSLGPLCVSTSEMPLRATLDVSNGSFTGVELVGMLRVPGAELHEGDLSLTATNADVSITAQWVLQKWLFCIANHARGPFLASCTLDSRTP